MIIVVKNDQVRAIYDERLDLRSLGAVSISRASYVEPDAQGQWWADLSPSGGLLIGPFQRRSEALASEVSWLEQHHLGNSRNGGLSPVPGGWPTQAEGGRPGRKGGRWDV